MHGSYFHAVNFKHPFWFPGLNIPLKEIENASYVKPGVRFS